MTVLPYLCEESLIRVEENSGKANDSLPNINVISTLQYIGMVAGFPMKKCWCSSRKRLQELKQKDETDDDIICKDCKQVYTNDGNLR